jgi:ribosome biogenesis GTPase A
MKKDVARQHPHIPELNVLVVGMPNVGKSTLLNVLRDFGIPGRMFCLIFSSVMYLIQLHICVATPKALRTSAQPGLTRALSTRLKLSEDPLVYSYDTPGVMLPFLGRGDRGAERGVKLALIGMQFHRISTSTIHEWTNSTWFSWYQGRAVRQRGARCLPVVSP